MLHGARDVPVASWFSLQHCSAQWPCRKCVLHHVHLTQVCAAHMQVALLKAARLQSDIGFLEKENAILFADLQQKVIL